MYVRPTSTRLFSGMLTPAMRAMALPLTLLVTRVLADHEHRAVAANDLALLAHGLDRRSDLHAPRSTFENLKRTALRAQETARAHGQLGKTSRGFPGRSGGLEHLAERLFLVPGSEDTGPLGGDRDRELEMGGERPVLGVDRPVVAADPDGRAPYVDHRLDGQDHALLERRALARRPEVRDLRVLMHVAADAVADELADDRKALLLDRGLHRVRDIAEAVADVALLDSIEQGLLRGAQEALGHRRYRADRDRDRRVGHPAVLDDADVDRQDVAPPELVRARDAVHDHRVRRRADRSREASVALEGRLGAVGADELLRRVVQLGGGHARTRLAREERVTASEDLARRGHLVELLRRLLDDHRNRGYAGSGSSRHPARAEIGPERPLTRAVVAGRAVGLAGDVRRDVGPGHEPALQLHVAELLRGHVLVVGRGVEPDPAVHGIETAVQPLDLVAATRGAGEHTRVLVLRDGRRALEEALALGRGGVRAAGRSEGEDDDGGEDGSNAHLANVARHSAVRHSAVRI